MNKKIVIITGQTACGKTSLGVFLSKKYNGEIVSFDSRQAYIGLDIITGKDFEKKSQKKIVIQKEEFVQYKINSIPIWMYDIISVDKIINSYDFVNKAKIIINSILERGKIPIIVGGSLFYINHLINNGFDFNVPPNWEQRLVYEKKSVIELQEVLKKIDKDKLLQMNNSDINNKRRLVRAIEIAYAKEKNIFFRKTNYQNLIIGLFCNEEKLKKNIAKRVAQRLKEGALLEISTILNNGINKKNPGLNTIGYKQLIEYIDKKYSYEEAVNNWQREEYKYAKRQKTFFNKINNINIFNIEKRGYIENIDQLVYKWLYESEG